MKRQSNTPIVYPIRVRGKDITGKTFKEDTTVSNPGTATLYFPLPCKVYQGAKLVVVIWLPAIGRLALRCVVRRLDARPNGTYGVVVKIMRYRRI